MKDFIRHPAHIPLEISPAESSPESAPAPGSTSGGLWFATDECWQVGSLLSIRIPVTEPAFEDLGRVAWCNPVNNHYEVGLSLFGADAAYRARMVEQICHIDEYRREVKKLQGRELSEDEAALEWIAQYAKDFPAPRTT